MLETAEFEFRSTCGAPRPRPLSRGEGGGGPSPAFGRDEWATVDRPSTLDEILEAFTEGWDRGERPRAERYLPSLPPWASAELIYHEYCLAEASDSAPDPAEYLRRFPDHSDSLRRLFALHGAVSASTLRAWAGPDPDLESEELPSAGDEIGSYRLVRELGRGAFARVFLAEEGALDHRLVVLKVSTRPTAEPRLLARARHAHIVEVLRQAEADDGALHLVFLPFLGGATLASVLQARRESGRRARSGLDLLDDLDRASAPEYPTAELDRPAREIIAGLSYPKALAWVVARLAEALDHAHRHGVAHGDLKPSNVLLTAEATPMLFDFNLAVDSRDLGPEDLATDLGGTLAYMAPERLRAIVSKADGPDWSPDSPLKPKAIDLHRADLYAMGLILLEALTGRAPRVTGGRRGGPVEVASALLESRVGPPEGLRGPEGRSIPPSLRSILEKCLATDPLDRYARGVELARDLDRWRLDRPIVFADEPRRAELARRARRGRFPLLAGALSIALAVAVASVASALMAGNDRDRALAKYETIRDRADSGAFGFRRFGRWKLDGEVDPVVASARLLDRYDVLKDPGWRDRPDVRNLPDRDRDELEALIFEQILRHAVALKARPHSPDDWRRGLALLDRTLARVASAPIQAERRALRAKLGLAEAAPSPAGTPKLPPWMDDYLAGVLAEPLHAREALGHYTHALRARPDCFWAHYRSAVVAWRIDENAIAVDNLRACVERSPSNPAPRAQLASALCYLERSTFRTLRDDPLAEALDHCNRALAIDPDYLPALRVRALVHKVSGRPDSTRSDVDRFALLGDPRGHASSLRLLRSLRIQAGPSFETPTETVIDQARRIISEDPRDLDTRASLGSNLAMTDHAAEAIAEFDRVLEDDPDQLRVRCQRAIEILPIDPDGAVAEFARLIEHPRFEELFREQPVAFRIYRHVATDLLGKGKVVEALDVAHRGLDQANRSRSLADETLNARLRSGNQARTWPRAESHFLIARIHAVAARADPRELDLAIPHLERAFERHPNFRENWFATNRDFDGLREEILRRMTSISR